jgi:hypothetical protein
MEQSISWNRFGCLKARSPSLRFLREGSLDASAIFLCNFRAPGNSLITVLFALHNSTASFRSVVVKIMNMGQG